MNTIARDATNSDLAQTPNTEYSATLSADTLNIQLTDVRRKICAFHSRPLTTRLIALRAEVTGVGCFYFFICEQIMLRRALFVYNCTSSPKVYQVAPLGAYEHSVAEFCKFIYYVYFSSKNCVKVLVTITNIVNQCSW